MKSKIIIIISLYFLMALSTACSDDTIQDIDNQEKASSKEREDLTNKVGYLAVKLNSSEKKLSTRDDTDAIYEEGDDMEKKIANFDILIFKSDLSPEEMTAEKELEAEYVGFASCYDNESDDVENSDDLDSKTIWIAMVDDILGTQLKNQEDLENMTGYYYAYIIANYPEEFKNKRVNYLNIHTFGDLYDIKYEDYNNLIKSGGQIALSKVIMSNAPEWRDDDDPHQLVNLNLGEGYVKWYPKGTIVKESMIENSAATFHLQRNVAKVTASKLNYYEYYDENTLVYTKYFDVYTSDELGNLENSDDVVGIQMWGVRQSNEETYLVQHTLGLQEALQNVTDKSRFHESRTNYFHRVFWSFDVNYDEEWEDRGHSVNRNVHNGNQPIYIFENTMSPANMLQDRSTLVIFIGNYFVGGKKNKYEDGSPKYTPFIMFPGNKRAYTIERLREEIKGHFETLTDEQVNLITFNHDISHEDGKTCIDDVLILGEGFPSAITKAKIAEIFNVLSDDYVIADRLKWTVNSMGYYVPIRHFNDNQLGSAGIPEEIHRGWTYDDNYLGRFGVLRNNWYDVNIDYISGPSYYKAYDDMPDDPDDPPMDDETAVIKCTVNVLNWIKHSQGASF